VSSWFIETSIITSNETIRSARSKYMLRGYSLSDYLLTPSRHKNAIPFSYTLLCATIDIISNIYHNNSYLKLAVTASFCLGYACSCRTAQYLQVSRSVPLTHQMNSSLSFFWWGSQYFNVCDISLFPPSIPDRFSTLIEYSKNDSTGRGGPKAIARCDIIPSKYDCLTNLFLFLSQYPPLLNQPLLSCSHISQINAEKHIKPILHLLSQQYGFNPDQLSVHSSIRSGALLALEKEPDAVKLRQGCWTTLGGMSSYLRGTLNHASSITNLLHDTRVCSILELQNIYNTKVSSV
jgi:hypothetical protein